MTSIFRYSKNYGSLTHETGIKYALNMEDLICLLATVRTLNVQGATANVIRARVQDFFFVKHYIWIVNNCKNLANLVKKDRCSF